MRILVVEDEKELNTMIRDYLETLGWTTAGAGSGTEALDLFRGAEFDFVLLDIMIPGLDGLDVMRRIRETSRVPVILITARAEEADKLIGLELGADDYVTKPFSLKELAARIRAVARRTGGDASEGAGEESILRTGDLEMDVPRRRVTRAGAVIELTQVQFDILHGLMLSPGRVFSRNEIQLFFQDQAWEGYDRTIDVHMKNIRKAVEPDREHPRYLETVRGVGYRLVEEPRDP
jgi:DNA-binding response OmpR family regulator